VRHVYAVHDHEGRIKSISLVSGSADVHETMVAPPGYSVSRLQPEEIEGIADDEERLREFMKEARIDTSAGAKIIRGTADRE